MCSSSLHFDAVIQGSNAQEGHTFITNKVKTRLDEMRNETYGEELKVEVIKGNTHFTSHGGGGENMDQKSVQSGRKGNKEKRRDRELKSTMKMRGENVSRQEKYQII